MLDKNKVATWYKCGLWSEAMIKNAVAKGALSEEDAAKILSEEVSSE